MCMSAYDIVFLYKCRLKIKILGQSKKTYKCADNGHSYPAALPLVAVRKESGKETLREHQKVRIGRQEDAGVMEELCRQAEHV